MKTSAPSLKEAWHQDVHHALSYILKAYSIFTPNPRIPLFQAVLLNSDRAMRHESPQITRLNLEAIVYEATSIPEMEPTPDLQRVIERLASEISDRVEPPRDKPMSSELESIKSEVSVSLSSLVRAEVAGIIPEMNAAFGGRFSRERRRAAKLKLTSLRSRMYDGSYLSIFLWQHGDFLFKRMLIYLHRDLGIRIGDRRLLAFVTKHMWGAVSILTNEFQRTDAGFSVPVPIGACFGSTHENEASCSDMGGVVGVHFIVFPVEKIEDDKWRFFPPIEIVDEENNGSDSSILFETASRWARGESGVNLHGSSESKDVSKDDLERIDAESSDSATLESSSTSEEAIPVVDYKDISLSEPRRVYIDVGLGESLEDFARRQYVIARHYKGLNDEEKLERMMHLLERASATGNREANVELAAFRNRKTEDMTEQEFVTLRCSECALPEKDEAARKESCMIKLDADDDMVDSSSWRAGDSIRTAEHRTLARWRTTSSPRNVASPSVAKTWKGRPWTSAFMANLPQDQQEAMLTSTTSTKDVANRVIQEIDNVLLTSHRQSARFGRQKWIWIIFWWLAVVSYSGIFCLALVPIAQYLVHQGMLLRFWLSIAIFIAAKISATLHGFRTGAEEVSICCGILVGIVVDFTVIEKSVKLVAMIGLFSLAVAYISLALLLLLLWSCQSIQCDRMWMFEVVALFFFGVFLGTILVGDFVIRLLFVSLPRFPKLALLTLVSMPVAIGITRQRLVPQAVAFLRAVLRRAQGRVDVFERPHTHIVKAG